MTGVQTCALPIYSFKRCAELGALPLVHAENGDVVARMQADLLARGVTGPEGHSYSRPPEVEGEAANRAIMIADMAGCPLYIVHVSCEETHEAIRRAKQAGKRVYGEPLVQFLVLDDSEYQNKDWDYAAGRVMSPPFRNKKHQDSLWAGLQSGTLSVVDPAAGRTLNTVPVGRSPRAIARPAFRAAAGPARRSCLRYRTASP